MPDWVTDIRAGVATGRFERLAILAATMKGATDRALLRGIRFVVGLPSPDDAARFASWQRQIPDYLRGACGGAH
jgi:hypothetical protein